MMHRRPIIAALSLLVGLSSHQLEVAFGFSIAPGSPRRGTTAAAAAVVDHPVSWTRLSSSLSLPVVVPPQIPITATKSTTMKWTSRTASFATVRPRNTHRVTTMTLSGARGGDDYYAAAGIDPSEIIARRIVVTGDVDGGYYRSCVKNEASRFRKLIGNMSPPDEDAKRAEIYVEGTRKMVDGFVRWCKRGDVGLSQSIVVESVAEELPTGMYDDFYVRTGR